MLELRQKEAHRSEYNQNKETLRPACFITEVRYISWPGARFSNVPKTFRARKAICKSANRLSRKADLLRYFQGNKNKLNAKFDDLNPLRSWDTEGIVTPENGP